LLYDISFYVVMTTCLIQWQDTCNVQMHFYVLKTHFNHFIASVVLVI